MKMNLIPFVLVFNCILLFTFAQRECKHLTENKIGDCNSKNPKNPKNCPLGTKANPLKFQWNLQYQKAAPDGFVRDVYTINEQTPGPTIHANKGDWVLISVTNSIKKPNSPEEYATIHWHGISMRSVERQQINSKTEPPGTPFMDGVPGINQCPIRYNKTFDYTFQCVDSGTFWYHSHQGIQLADGFVGSLIVKDCNDTKRFGYNEDDDWDVNIVNVQDWYHEPAEDILERYKKINDTTNFTTTVNGKAVPKEQTPFGGLVGGKMFNDCDQTCINGTTTKPRCVCQDYKVYKFVEKRKYRLRIISMAIMSMAYFSIDNHTFEIIEVDGMLVERNNTTQPDLWWRIPINSGQRYSILITADQKPDNYWMRFNFPYCSYRDETPPDNNEAKAIVRYDDEHVPEEDPKTPGEDVGCDKCNCTDLDVFALMPLCDKESDHKYDLFCDYQPPSVVKYNFTMDIAMDAWKQPLLVNQKDEWEHNIFGYIADKAHGITPYAEYHFSNSFNNTFLEVLKIKNNGFHGWDPLMNAYNLIDRNSIVDILFSNIDTMEHPIHLHGHFFYVLGWGQNGTNYSESLLNIKDPIQRDSVTVPKLGWLKIRFAVDNPGVWPMHCHIDWHIAVGMLAQFVEIPGGATNTFNKEENKAPYEWCKACTAVPDATQYCAARLQ